MSAQHEVNRRSRCAAKNNRIVREQEFHLVRARACERQRDVFETDHRVVDTREPECCSILFEAHSLIDQDRNSLGAEEVCQQRRIDPVVVVSQNCVDAVFRLQMT